MLGSKEWGRVASVRTQAQGDDVGAGDQDVERVEDLLNRNGRRLVQVDVWRTDARAWPAGVWCIDQPMNGCSSERDPNVTRPATSLSEAGTAAFVLPLTARFCAGALGHSYPGVQARREVAENTGEPLPGVVHANQNQENHR